MEPAVILHTATTTSRCQRGSHGQLGQMCLLWYFPVLDQLDFDMHELGTE